MFAAPSVHSTLSSGTASPASSADAKGSIIITASRSAASVRFHKGIKSTSFMLIFRDTVLLYWFFAQFASGFFPTQKAAKRPAPDSPAVIAIRKLFFQRHLVCLLIFAVRFRLGCFCRNILRLQLLQPFGDGLHIRGDAADVLVARFLHPRRTIRRAERISADSDEVNQRPNAKAARGEQFVAKVEAVNAEEPRESSSAAEAPPPAR